MRAFFILRIQMELKALRALTLQEAKPRFSATVNGADLAVYLSLTRHIIVIIFWRFRAKEHVPKAVNASVPPLAAVTIVGSTVFAFSSSP